MEHKTQLSVQEETSNNNSPLLITVICIIVTAGVVGGAVFFWQEYSNKKIINRLEQQISDLKQQISDNQTLSDNQEILSAGIESQKTYTNSRYGYSVNFPSDWYVDATYSEDDFTQRGPEGNRDFIGGDTYFANYPDLLSYNLGNIPSDLFSVALEIYKIDMGVSYDQFISLKGFGPGERDNIIIDGRDAVRLTGVVTGNSKEFTVTNVLIKDGDRMFLFNYSIGYSEDSDSRGIKDIAEGIVNSFIIK